MKKKSGRKDQISDVIKEERNRFRRPLAAEIARDREEKLRIVHAALRKPTEEEFLQTMRTFGLIDGSPELEAALEAWRNCSS